MNDGTDEHSDRDDGTDEHSDRDDGTDEHSDRDDGTDEHSDRNDGTDQQSDRNERTVDQEVILIAALAESNRVIGHEMELPWHIPEDLRRFKRLTLGKPLIMGRTTYQAIIEQFGAPLTNRRTVVLSSRGAVDGLEGVETYKSIADAMHGLSDAPEIYIGGGGGVYAQFLPLATRMELTLVEGDFEGDTYFPAFEESVGDEFVVEAEDRRDGYRFVTYRRMKKAPPSSST